MIKKNTLFLLLLCMVQSYAANYYFSSSTGNDANSGSQTSPFKTITKLNGLTLVAGDKIYFKKGDTFIGQITVGYSGTATSPIVFDSYGTGNLPILSGSDGSNGIADPICTIYIQAKSHLEFKNLQIENERFDAKSGVPNDQSFGIYYLSYKTVPASGNPEDAVLTENLKFTNLVVQNVYSLGSGGTNFDNIYTSGIYLNNAFVKNVSVENCYFTDIERTGLWLRGYVFDALIKNNKFIATGGSGTILSQTRRVLYENNLMRFTGSDTDPRMTKRGSGMWVFGSQDVAAQYNVSQHARGNGDSSGMHVDYGNTNILFQYNYLEDSAGGFCETLGKNNNVIWRYNISVNEGQKERDGKNILFWVSDYSPPTNTKSTNVYVYNNTIYQGLNYQNVMADSKIDVVSNDFNFVNNIVYMEPTAKIGVLSYVYDVATTFMRKNIMYSGTINADFKSKNYAFGVDKINENPQFLNPGRKDPSGYKLLTNSPAIGYASTGFTEPEFPLGTTGLFVNISKKATKDYFGNPVNLASTSNIGAYNGAAVTSSSTASREAESTSNTIVGGTQVTCTKASGGKAVNVSSIGQSLTFNNFNVSNTGLHLIKVFYANPYKSNLVVTINGGTPETFILPNSDLFCYQSGTPTSFFIAKTLNSGNNSIKLEGSIIDKIEVIFISGNGSSARKSQVDKVEDGLLYKEDAYLEKTLLSSNENLKLIIDKKIEYNNAEVSIYDISGALLLKKYFTTGEINVEVNNLGKGVKIVTARVGDHFFVEKIIVQ